MFEHSQKKRDSFAGIAEARPLGDNRRCHHHHHHHHSPELPHEPDARQTGGEKRARTSRRLAW